MSDQGSETQAEGAQGTTTATGNATETKSQTSTEDVLAKFAAKVEALEKDNRAYREKLRALSAADEEAKKKAGDYEPLIKQRDEELAALKARLAELEPDATFGRSLREQRMSAVAEKAKALDDDERSLVDAVSDVQAREKLVDKLLAAKTAKPAPAPLPKGEPPATSGRVTAERQERKGFSIF